MRKARVGSATIKVGAAVVLLGVAGCSSVPDEVNPAEWYRSASSWISSKPAPESEPAGPAAVSGQAAAERADTFPNLASVPQRPAPTPDPMTRREAVSSMRRDSATAQAEATALNERAAAELARREKPMATPLPAPQPGTPSTQGPVASLTMPPTSETMPPATMLSAPSAPATLPMPSSAPTSQATVAPPVTAPQPAAPAAMAPSPAPAAPSVPPQPVSPQPAAAPSRTAGFAPGAPVAPRPPVMPPQPLSQRAAG